MFLHDRAVSERLAKKRDRRVEPPRRLEVLDMPAGVEMEGEDFIVAELLLAPTAREGLGDGSRMVKGWKGW